MFLRFFSILVLAPSLLCCGQESQSSVHLSKAPISDCPPIEPKLSQPTVTTIEQYRKAGRPHLFGDSPLLSDITALMKDGHWSSDKRNDLQRLSLAFANRFGLEVFVEIGRHIALTAFDSHTTAADGVAPQLSPTMARALFVHLANDSNFASSGLVIFQASELTNSARILGRHAIALHLWSSLLDHRFQVRQWWKPWEYRWLLEATVTGLLPSSPAQRVTAHRALIQEPNYPKQWNETALRLLTKDSLTETQRSQLTTVMPARCLQTRLGQ